MKRIRGFLVASTLGLAAVEAPMDDTLGSARPGDQGGRAVTACLDGTETLSDANGGPASDQNSDDDKPRRRV